MKWLKYLDKPALICEDRKYHYGQLMNGLAAVGDQLRNLYGPQARIGIIGANCPAWALALFSIWHARSTAVPIDFMSTAEEIAYILQDSKPVALFTDAATEPKLREAFQSLTETPPEIRRLEDIAELMENVPATPCPPEENPDDDLALLLYTSGTTGSPKGVMLTFGNLLSNAEACTTQIEVFIPDDRVLVALPLHHIYPLMASIVMPMTIGATAVFATSLTGAAIMSALHDHQCTFIVGVPRLLEIIRNSLLKKIHESWLASRLLSLSAACGSLKLSRLIFRKVQEAFGGHIRYISSGGAAADPQVVKDFYALGFHLLEGYGMTETSPMISFTPPERHKPGSPGKPIPCNEVRIQDSEVLVRGKNVMKGYYNRPEETAQIIDHDGWLHTGDLGYLDEDGFLFLTGRSKELIILGNGKNINPVDLEQKLMDYADGLFTECAVTDDGQHLVCLLVPDQEALASRGILNIRQTLMDKVIEPFNEAVPSYKRLARLELCEQPLPRTRLGKPRRHLIRQLLERGFAKPTQETAEKPVTLETPLGRQICQCLEEFAGRPVGADEHFELDLYLDSLGKMALLTSLCKALDRELDMKLLAQYPTARLLTAALENSQAGSEIAVQAPTFSVHRPACTHRLYRWFASLGLRCLSHFSVDGQENIPQGPCIFAPNHQSLLDGFYLASALPAKKFTSTYYYVISKFIDGGLRRWFASRHNLVAMELNGDLRQSLATLVQILRQGQSVTIFPEGTRSMDGHLGDFSPTFAQLALQAKVPIVPVAIKGAFEVLPRWAHFPSFGKTVRLSFLPPVQPDDDASSQELRQETKDRIQRHLEA